MTAKNKFMFLVLIIIMCLPFILACDDGGIQDTGQDVVNTVLFEQSQLEQDVINTLQQNCAQSTECANHQLP